MGMLNFRRRIGLTQAELGAAVGVGSSIVSQSAISEIEHGDRYPTYQQIVDLLKAGATVEELFGLEYPVKPAQSAAWSKIVDHQVEQNAKQDVAVKQLQDLLATKEIKDALFAMFSEYKAK